MLVESLFNGAISLINGILDLLDVLPEFPEDLIASMDSFFFLIFDNLPLLGFFVRLDTVKILTPLVIVVINFEDIYAFVMWILRKIPFIGVE